MSIAKRIILAVGIAAILTYAGIAPAFASLPGIVRVEWHYAARISHWRHYQLRCLHKLWMRESGWSDWAVNSQSGAYGIPQALGHGHPFPLGRYRPQIRWGIFRYIKPVYGGPCRAWKHEEGHGWY